MIETKFIDGSAVILGARVYRTYPLDGSKQAGKRRGPLLKIVGLKPHRTPHGPEVPGALATLRVARTGLPAGVEPVWKLRRGFGRQPDSPQKRRIYSPEKRDQYVSSIRLPPEFRRHLELRGTEVTTIIRRDLSRLYDLLDDTRARMIFPVGTIDALTTAWTRCAPPPPNNVMRPQWFVSVLSQACAHFGTAAHTRLVEYAATWTPLEAFAVLDACERWTPEETTATRLRACGLHEDETKKAKKAS